ncbi:MAG: beta-glucosidase [Candidatus Riflebacteria bacterium]|nr:beta-glucosidase [Candidatus Riflebacteria bacterium]
MKFPEGFIWGAATASCQIEGAAQADGKGPSIWDSFCKKPGVIADASTPEHAGDHYNLFRDDVALMKQIGIQAYRFSISWPRVLPDGTGRVNEAGISFYENLVDSLLCHNIQPWVTLFHWDYPQALYDRGGWLNEQSSDWFESYVRLIVDRLSDRVTHWITLNEPQVYIEYGHKTGIHAPGLNLAFTDILKICHNSLLAHGKAVKTIREHAKKTPIIGVAPVGIIGVPLQENPENIDAARSTTFGIKPDSCWNNIWFGDPMVLGHYPEDGLRLYGDLMPDFPASDLELIKQPLDFYGTNIYTADLIKAEKHDSWALPNPPQVVNPPAGMPRSAMDWPVVPESLYWGTRFLYERYKLPVVITENGMASHDWPCLDGQVHDSYRIDYTTRYLNQIRRACREGIACPGYFHWSLLDNFEWAFGYSRRFGLIYIDYQTQKRILKDSALWYADVIKSNGAGLGLREKA